MNKTIIIYSKEIQEKNNEKPYPLSSEVEFRKIMRHTRTVLFAIPVRKKNFFKKIKVNSTTDILKTLKGEFQILAQKNGRTLKNLKNVHKFSTNNKKQQTLTINIPVY